MSPSPSSANASQLLSQSNELLANLARLNSNVQLYTQIHSLQENFNTLDKKYKSAQNNIKTSTCNSQCKKLNETKDPNSIDDFLINLILSNKNNSSSSVAAPPETVNQAYAPQASAPPLEAYAQASAPPLED